MQKKPSPFVYCDLRVPQEMDPEIAAPWQALVNINSRKRYYFNTVTNVTTQVRPVPYGGAMQDDAPHRPLSIDKTFMRRSRKQFYCPHELRLLGNELRAFKLLKWDAAWPDIPGAPMDDEEAGYTTWLMKISEDLDNQYFWEHAVPRFLSAGLYNPDSRWSDPNRGCHLPLKDCLDFNSRDSRWVLEGDVFRSKLVLPSEVDAAACQQSGTLEVQAACASAPCLPKANSVRDSKDIDDDFSDSFTTSQVFEDESMLELTPSTDVQWTWVHVAGNVPQQGPEEQPEVEEEEKLERQRELEQQKRREENGWSSWRLGLQSLRNRKGHKE